MVEFPEIYHGVPDSYLDRFTKVWPTLFSSSHFDEYHNVSTTYLGRLIKDKRRIALENDIQLNASCMATGHLLDQTPVRMLFETGASKTICLSPSTLLIKVCTKYPSLALLAKVLQWEMDNMSCVICDTSSLECLWSLV